MNLLSFPDPWSSVHRPVDFGFSFYNKAATITTDPTGLKISTTSDMDITNKVDDLIFIESGIYKGAHKILSLTNQSIFVVEGTFTANSSSDVLNLFVPEFSILSGHLPGLDPYPIELPQELFVSFIPEFNIDFQVAVNLSGYLKSIFKIIPPVSDGIDFGLFNKFRLLLQYEVGRWFADSTNARNFVYGGYNVLNSSIKTSVLNANYLNSNTYLSPSFPYPFLFTCGKTILSKLSDEAVVNATYFPNIPQDCDFNDDYNDDYFIC